MLLGFIVVTASLLGWYSASQSAAKYKQKFEELAYRSSRLEFSIKSRYLKELAQKDAPESNRVAFSNSNFDGLDFYGASLVALRGFEQASFKDSNFQNSTIKIGQRAFLSIFFDNANLQSAKLEGGEGSFYSASFVNANMTSAILYAPGSSFSNCSFRNANLTDAAIISEDGFISNDISAASFDGTDLSSMSAESLKTCFFGGAPTYSSTTKFPQNFDPKAAGWKLKESSK
jgi:uncharacterized protein YjbI with pentapeptide repeats